MNSRSATSVSRANATGDAATPMAHSDKKQMPSSEEVHPEADTSLDQSLPHISQAHSSDDGSSVESAKDGRWNIPFDSSSEDELVAKSSTQRREVAVGALMSNGFIPINEGCQSYHPGSTAVIPWRPLARRTVAFPHKAALSEKENASPEMCALVGEGKGSRHPSHGFSIPPVCSSTTK